MPIYASPPSLIFRTLVMNTKWGFAVFSGAASDPIGKCQFYMSHSYGHLSVITGYKWDYTFYKWGYKYL